MSEPQMEQSRQKPFFSSAYERSLDSQYRVPMPSEWRRRNKDLVLVLVPGMNNDLLLLPFYMMDEYMEKLSREAMLDPDLQLVMSWIGSSTRECLCDKQGRIKLDRELLESIGVESKLQMIGSLSYIRICAPENWPQKPKDMKPYLDKVKEACKGDSLSEIFRNALKNKK